MSGGMCRFSHNSTSVVCTNLCTYTHVPAHVNDDFTESFQSNSCFLKHLCLNLHSFYFCLCPGVCNAILYPLVHYREVRLTPEGVQVSFVHVPAVCSV